MVGLELQPRNTQPRTLVCHDMQGGYTQDRFNEGSNQVCREAFSKKIT